LSTLIKTTEFPSAAAQAAVQTEKTEDTGGRVGVPQQALRAVFSITLECLKTLFISMFAIPSFVTSYRFGFGVYETIPFNVGPKAVFDKPYVFAPGGTRAKWRFFEDYLSVCDSFESQTRACRACRPEHKE
jgi:hypothetical protein